MTPASPPCTKLPNRWKVIALALLLVISAADWDVWGNASSTSGVQSGLGWTGELRDPATNLTYLRARDYSPGTARFTSRDSLTMNGAGSQAYQPYGYADLNPKTYGDPSGHQAAMSGYGGNIARCVICTPVLASIMAYFMAQQMALAAAAPGAMSGGIVRANQWALAGFALVIAILTCIVTPACHVALPRVVDGGAKVGQGATEDMEQLFSGIMAHLRQVREPAPVPEPKPKQKPDTLLPPNLNQDPDRSDKNCQLKSITRWNFDYNLACDTKINWTTRPYGPPNTQAHHVFPRRFEQRFNEIPGMSSIHHPRYGQWWSTITPPTHQRSWSQYNVRWEAFLDGYRPNLPAIGETLTFGRQVMNEFSQGARY